MPCYNSTITQGLLHVHVLQINIIINNYKFKEIYLFLFLNSVQYNTLIALCNP